MLELDTGETDIETADEANVQTESDLSHPVEQSSENFVSSEAELPDDIHYDALTCIMGTQRDQQQMKSATFLLKLREICNASERTVHEVVDGCKDLFANSFSSVKASVKESMGKYDMTMSAIEELDQILSDVPNPFEGLETIHLQDKFFKNHFQLLVRISIHNIIYCMCACAHMRVCDCVCVCMYMWELYFLYMHACV